MAKDKCKHLVASLWWWTGSYWAYACQPRRPDRNVCDHCGAWLSLGPANDDSEAVRIEIRAAELEGIVSEMRRLHRTAYLSDIGFDGAEIAGWIECQYDSEKLPEQFGEQAGYLASCIATHDEEQS